MDLLNYSKEAHEALLKRAPIVALESTIIAHGMPYPQNLETARAVEDIVRKAGATPATIALLKGKIHVGLEPDELETLATAKDVIKASRRDLPVARARGLNAATTVASTMICAHLAGVKVFVTGGIGGVHRGAAATFDISADLQELANTDVAVVCAGAKSILDLPLTLEYLETFGVPVIGYQTDELPAFYCRESGLKLEARADTPLEAARIIKSKSDLKLKGGLLICNPVPAASSMPRQEIDGIIEAALGEADAKGIQGKALTPFLLSRIAALTAGRSLQANIALVQNNALVGAQIAVELARLNHAK